MENSRCRYVVTFPGISKCIILIFGLAVIIVGLRSFYESSWYRDDFYKICKLFQFKNNEEPCPSIEMERFFVAIIVTCFTLSVANLILSLSSFNPHRPLFWISDFVYHLFAAILLFIAGILYIVSAVHINSHVSGNANYTIWTPPRFKEISETGVFLSTQKIIAGAITILWSFEYIGVGISIKRWQQRQRSFEEEEDDEEENED